MESDHWISEIESCGWFDDLPESEVSALKGQLSTDSQDLGYLHLASVVINDPNRISGGIRLMDAEEPGEITSYEKLLKAYTEASEGHFAPEAMVEEINDETGHFAIGFLFSGRIYAIFVPGTSRYEEELNDMVNEALADAGCHKRFFRLPASSDKRAFAFISPAVYEKACLMELIPADEDLLAGSCDPLDEIQIALADFITEDGVELNLQFERQPASQGAEILTAW